MGPALAEEASGAGAAAGFSPGDKTKRGFGGPSAARRGLPCDWAPGEGDGAWAARQCSAQPRAPSRSRGSRGETLRLRRRAVV